MGNITGRTTVQATGLNAYLASNDGDEELDLAMTDTYTAAVTATDTFTITDVATTYNFTRNGQFLLTDGGITGVATILVPAVKKAFFAVKNTTGFDCTVGISGQAEAVDTVPDGTSAMFTSDGVNVRIAGGGVSAGTWIDLTDTDPTTYVAQAGKHVRVNATPDGLEFADPTLEELTDVNSLAAATTGQVLAKASGGEAEWVAQSAGSGDALPYVLSPAWRGARIRGQAQTGVNLTSFTKVLFDTTNVDTDSISDLGNERLVVPAGVTKIKIHGHIGIGDANTSGNLLIEIRKNGSSSIDGHVGRSRWERSNTGPDNEYPVSLGTVNVVENDYFELWVLIQGDTVADVAATSTWLEMEIVETTDTVPSLRTVVASLPAKWRGARTIKAADLTGQNLTTASVLVTFDTVVRDTDSLFVDVNDEFIIPAGVAKVRIKAALEIANAVTTGTEAMVLIAKDGATSWSGMNRTRSALYATGGAWGDIIDTGVIDVVAGESYTMRVVVNGDTTVDIKALGTWFEIEIVEFNSSTDAVQAYIAVPPEHKGAQIDTTTAQSLTNASFNDIILENIIYDTSFDPGDDGPPQRFWLGVDWIFVDGDVTVGTDQITETAHGYQTGEGPVTLTSTGTLPAGLALATKYWIIRVDANELKFATSRANALAGTAVDITAAAGTGNHSVVQEQYLVVPANVSKVRLFGYGVLTGGTGDFTAQIHKNDATFRGGGIADRVNTANADTIQVLTPTVEVVEGDRFNLAINPASGTVTLDNTLTEDTYFQIEVVEETRAISYPGVTVTPPFVGGKVSLAVQTADANLTTPVVVTWDTEDEDTNGFWAVSPNPTRLTIPTGQGIKRVNLLGSLHYVNSTADGGDVNVQIFKNGTRVEESLRIQQSKDAATTRAFLYLQGVIVADGDYFELFGGSTGADVTVAFGVDSSFSIEVTETDENAFPPENSMDFFELGTPATTTVLWRRVFRHRVTMGDALAGSYASFLTGPSSAIVFDVDRNGTKIGEVLFAASGTVATFTTVAAQQYVFDVGDYLDITSPVNLFTAANLQVDMHGWRS